MESFAVRTFDILWIVGENLIIAVVTFILCIFGLLIGRKVGTKLSGVASILGGCILIAIGLEIFIKGIL